MANVNTIQSQIFCLLSVEESQWCLMVSLNLLLIAILTVCGGATPLYCSDVQLTASGGYNTDLSQVIILQYCIIDNCTIVRIDNEQQLDIVYTTRSLLIVTPKDSHTFLVIAKADDELPCLEYPNTSGHDDIDIFQLIQLVTTALTVVVSAYTVIVHLLFKTLRSAVFGRLLLLYNLFVVPRNIVAIALLSMHFWIVVNSQAVCYTATIAAIILITGGELFAANILYHLTYIMYRCYHMKSELSKNRSEYLFRRYIGSACFTLILFFFVTIAYDCRTGVGQNTIMANGQCSFLDPFSYNTLFLFLFIVIIVKFLQITMFSAYLFYYYKFNLNAHAAQVTLRYKRQLFKIAIAIGATVGFSFFTFTLTSFFPMFYDVTLALGGIMYLSQQVVIMTTFMCTNKMYSLCKSYITRD